MGTELIGILVISQEIFKITLARLTAQVSSLTARVRLMQLLLKLQNECDAPLGRELAMKKYSACPGEHCNI